MDNREILTRFKNGTLDRQHAVALLTGAPLAPAPPSAAPAPVPSAGGEAGRPAIAGGPVVVPVPSGTEAVSSPVTADDPAHARVPAGRADADDRFAVIGIGGRYPQAPDLAAFWHNLLEGRDTAAAAPPGRDAGDAGDGGHFLEHVDEFDTAFFGLTDEEAVLTDPQERLFLHTAWETLEAAGQAGARLDALVSASGRPRSLGVYAAAGSHDYLLLAAGQWTPGRALPAAGHGSLPGRLSALLDLSGPSQCVDAGESSFLVALHQALAALRAGECAAALVGAVELRLHPSRQGPGAGEGVGAVLLKPLAAAQQDGDTVHAVIRSTAVAHAGRSGGDGGDDQDGAAGPPPAEGGTLHESGQTVRAGVGDAGAATGAAALTRAVLQVRSGTLAAAGAQSGAGPWDRPRRADGVEGPRRASVVVRGSAGTQARAVVEEYLPDSGTGAERDAAGAAGEDDGQPQLVLVSAPTLEHLAATARRLAAWLTARGRPAGALPGLGALARELRCGRAALDCRLAVTAQDSAQLATALDEFAAQPQAAADRGRRPAPVTGLARTADTRPRPGSGPLLDDLPETRAYLTALWHGHRFEQLTRLWLAGVDVTRAAIPAGPVVALPTSALRPRSLWLGPDGAAGTGTASERTR
ncbi:beta-ketoacyl synthase N-terminal-like domain-containing protein [Streptomyces albicerus]|uniref:beta-ketoacyl synthase N-terminal-like domain-containing protein n=1 Tax=Streptomyces albicerus TaxID=2569859 RepID=UPI00124B02B1|nr:beta-ketoacyl synthase N-terminal-like domain-containing protein [Streptomyces albicerus]